ncbi:MAG: FAD-dependent oxidoreductase [Phormidesmis sp.]
MKSIESIATDILVIGGGAGGTAAAMQAARRGLLSDISVTLVSDLPWLGGMLTSAGVSAPDGNELAAFQTGIWGAFLRALRQRHPEGLGNGWVSFFTYNPAVGAQIFADWVAQLPNLQWISGQRLKEVLRDGDRITGVRFETLTVQAKVILDGTELGDVLALGQVPHRWGWETQDSWQEPSAPVSLSDPADALYAITQRYPVQSPTWVVIMQDYGAIATNAPTDVPIDAPTVERPPSASSNDELHRLFEGAWENYGDTETSASQTFLNYGRLPGHRFMINWPHKGNDYGVGLDPLIESDAASAQYEQEAQWHSQAFARFIQQQLGSRYGLATDIFPKTDRSPGGGFALMPYYRESRRLIGLTTISERDILPAKSAPVAPLPLTQTGETDAIALGNYPNDHHYPGFEMPLAPKAIRWGGRWTGTPFTIPYRSLVPASTDGLLVCEKNISVSHIANGATRLQPVVLGIGQAAGMAAALCVEKGCEPRELEVRSLQLALITEPTAPAAVIPIANLPPQHPDWVAIQQHYLRYPNQYLGNYSTSCDRLFPISQKHTSQKHTSQKQSNLKQTSQKQTSKKQNEAPTEAAIKALVIPPASEPSHQLISVTGKFVKSEEGHYQLHQKTAKNLPDCLTLVTVEPAVAQSFKTLQNERSIQISGQWNAAGKWLLCCYLITL